MLIITLCVDVCVEASKVQEFFILIITITLLCYLHLC